MENGTGNVPQGGTDYWTNDSFVIDTTTYSPYGQIHIVSFKLQDGKIEVVKRQASNVTYTDTYTGVVPDMVWKEIYGVVDNEIALIKKIYGRHIPQSYVSERFEFDE